MKSLSLTVSLALNLVLGVLLIMAATRSNAIAAPAPSRGVQRVSPRAVNFAKNAGMAAAVGGLSMMGQAPVHAFEAYERPQVSYQQEYARPQLNIQTPQMVQQTAEMTPSLKRYLYSILAAGGVVAGVIGAVSAVAKFDQIERS
ncbi:hypothetical protein AAMO2058_000530600 [Amorphochlora amoebiformis]|mmetsp:Transcript_20286/g.32148  ORF Transcript_20286/g.32148 Transcript_20286/m.32148 type:complete len:144 (-) Transcript_20286:185-616(-)|eukprot:1385065-Amorphochlora_amoeboformis.AAC.1